MTIGHTKRVPEDKGEAIVLLPAFTELKQSSLALLRCIKRINQVGHFVLVGLGLTLAICKTIHSENACSGWQVGVVLLQSRDTDASLLLLELLLLLLDEFEIILLLLLTMLSERRSLHLRTIRGGGGCLTIIRRSTRWRGA